MKIVLTTNIRYFSKAFILLFQMVIGSGCLAEPNIIWSCWRENPTLLGLGEQEDPTTQIKSNYLWKLYSRTISIHCLQVISPMCHGSKVNPLALIGVANHVSKVTDLLKIFSLAVRPNNNFWLNTEKTTLPWSYSIGHNANTLCL